MTKVIQFSSVKNLIQRRFAVGFKDFNDPNFKQMNRAERRGWKGYVAWLKSQVKIAFNPPIKKDCAHSRWKTKDKQAGIFECRGCGLLSNERGSRG